MEQINHIEYPKRLRKLSDDALNFIIADCHEAIKANPQATKVVSGYYADEIAYASMEKKRRLDMAR